MQSKTDNQTPVNIYKSFIKQRNDSAINNAQNSVTPVILLDLMEFIWITEKKASLYRKTGVNAHPIQQMVL